MAFSVWDQLLVGIVFAIGLQNHVLKNLCIREVLHDFISQSGNLVLVLFFFVSRAPLVLFAIDTVLNDDGDVGVILSSLRAGRIWIFRGRVAIIISWRIESCSLPICRVFFHGFFVCSVKRLRILLMVNEIDLRFFIYLLEKLPPLIFVDSAVTVGICVLEKAKDLSFSIKEIADTKAS